MTAPTCALTLNVADLAGANVSGATVTATLSHPDAYQGMVVAGNTSGTTDSSGNVTLTLFRSALGELGSYYTISAATGGGLALGSLHVRLPNLSAATLALCEVARRPFRYSAGTTADVQGRVLSVGGVLPDAGGDVPLSALPVVHATVFDLEEAAPTLTADQLGISRIDSNGVRFLFKDATGALREFLLPLGRLDYMEQEIDASRWPYYLDPSAADNTAGLDTVFAAAGARANIIGPVTVKLPGEYRSKGNHVLSGLVSIWVADTTSHGIKRIEDPDYVGPMLTLIPTVGGSSGGRLRQSIKCLLDGNLAHVHKFSGAVSLGSDVITGIDSALVAAMPIGSIVEIEGMPDWTHNTPATTLLEKPSSTSIRVSAVGVQANTGKPNGIWRETVKFTATATTGSKVLAVSNTTGIKRGMKLLDNTPHHLAIDSDDGGSYSRVASIVPGVSVTMDRAATADGAFDCWAYVEPDGVWVVDANQAVGYASNKEYEAVQFDVRINTTGGNGITIGRGRDQIKIIRPSKITSSYGHNLIATESKDSLFTFETGTPWKSGITMSGSGIRWEGEAYDPRQPSKYKIIDVGDNKADLSHYDMNGMCSFTRAQPGGVPLTQLTAGNHMMHPSDINVGGVTPAYITGKSGHVIHGNGLAFMCTDGATNGKPDYLFQSVGGSHFIWTGGMMYGDIAEPDCPYAIAPCADMRKIHGEYFDLGTGEMVSFDDAGRTDQTFTPVVSCVTPGDLSVSYTVQEGWVSVSDGVATVTIVVEFVPTYSTASGGIRISGMPVQPSSAASNPMISAAIDSVGCDWGTGFTTLIGRVKSTGTLSIERLGDNLAGTQLLLESCPSGVTQRFELAGTFRV